MEFKVIWNEEVYGETEPKTVSMAEFLADGIEGNWGIDKDGEFTIDHLKNLKVGNTHTVYAPYGWSIKITKINNEEGFEFNDVWITDPTKSECGRFEVDPKEYYGIDK